MNVGVIGVGYWNHYVRLLSENESVEQVYAFDLIAQNLQKTKADYPQTICDTDYTKYLDKLDCVVVCTPSATHYNIAKQCLEAGLYVLIEKPMAQTIDECADLISIAAQNNVSVFVGHTYEYNPHFRAMLQSVTDGKIGDVKYCTFNRIGNSPIRTDVNAAMDLMTHDFYMAIKMFGMPDSISAVGKSFLQQGIEDVAFVVCEFKNGIICNFVSSWISPIKERRIVIVGDNGMMVFDDIKKEVVRNNEVIFVSHIEPLSYQLKYFLEFPYHKKLSENSAKEGCEVVRLLQACNWSLRNNSEKVYL